MERFFFLKSRRDSLSEESSNYPCFLLFERCVIHTAMTSVRSTEGADACEVDAGSEISITKAKREAYMMMVWGARGAEESSNKEGNHKGNWWSMDRLWCTQ